MEDNRIQNQIAIYMTNKKLCEFTDKLKPAPIEYSCIDLMDLSLHRPNVETEFASFTPATEVNHEE